MCNMCVVINYFISFTQYLLFIQSSDRGLFEAGYFGTNIYNAVQLDLVNVKKEMFSEAVKTLFTFLVCDTALVDPFQPIVSCCADKSLVTSPNKGK